MMLNSNNQIMMHLKKTQIINNNCSKPHTKNFFEFKQVLFFFYPSEEFMCTFIMKFCKKNHSIIFLFQVSTLISHLKASKKNNWKKLKESLKRLPREILR